MRNNDTKVMSIILLIAVAPFTMVVSGYVLSILWGWFVAPLFGVPELGVINAIGLAIIIAYMTRGESSVEKNEDIIIKIVNAFLKPSFALLIGWLVTLFM